MMDAVNDATVLHLCDGLTVVPFDTGACEQEYVAVLPDGRHYRLTLRLRQLINCIDGQRSLAEVAELLSHRWQHPVCSRQVWQAVQCHLTPNGLLKGMEGKVPASETEKVFTWQTRLLSSHHTYFFTQVGQYLFTWPAMVLSLAVIFLAHYGIYGRFDNLWELARSLGAVDFLVLYGLVIISVLVHELGHASACCRFGEDYGDIGLALYLVFPVFYADVTRIWKLGRRQRLVVDLGGMYFQLLVGVFYYLIYHISGNRLWLLAAVQIDALVLLAFNPIVKFDGYWVVSDLLGVPNLHRRMAHMVRGLLGRPGDAEITLMPAVQAWLWLYMLLFSAIIVLSLGYGLTHMPEMTQHLIVSVRSNLHVVSLGWQRGDALMIVAGLVRLVLSLSVVLGACFMLLRAVRGMVKIERRRSGHATTLIESEPSLFTH